MTTSPNRDEVLAELERSAQEVAGIVRAAEATVLTVRPDADRWSVRDVLAHLVDTERLIFRHRIERFMAEPPDPIFPDIDHTPWETVHNYQSAAPLPKLDEFIAERAKTISVLTALSSADWSRRGTHEIRGSIILADVAAYCATHTDTHARQIERTLQQVQSMRAQ